MATPEQEARWAREERREQVWKAIFALAIASAVGALATAICLGIQHDYRWKSACAADRGVAITMGNGSRVCATGDLHLVTIAVRPW